MLLERARQGKLTQAVSDHVFSDKHRIEHFAVMDVKGQPDKIRRDHRAARPGFDRLLGLGLLGFTNLFQEVAVDERPFFY